MHKSYEELGNALEAAAEIVEIGGLYAHYKNPSSRYRVLGFTVLEASDEVAVRYISINHEDVEFTRPLVTWVESIDGNPRYTFVGNPTD